MTITSRRRTRAAVTLALAVLAGLGPIAAQQRPPAKATPGRTGAEPPASPCRLPRATPTTPKDVGTRS